MEQNNNQITYVLYSSYRTFFFSLVFLTLHPFKSRELDFEWKKREKNKNARGKAHKIWLQVD